MPLALAPDWKSKTLGDESEVIGGGMIDVEWGAFGA